MGETDFKQNWVERVLLFGDGAHGSSVQVHQVGWGIPSEVGNDDGKIAWTPIVWVWRKESHDDRGTRRWYYGVQEVADFNDAARVWRDGGEPVVTDVAGQDYLDGKKLKGIEP